MTSTLRDPVASSRDFALALAAPGPRSLPLLGVLPEIVRRRGVLLALLHYWRTYGDVVQADLGLTTAVFLARPQAVQRVLVDNRDNYPRSRQSMESVAGFLGEGLGSSEGAHWRRQRHFMQGPFAVSAVPAYADAMVSATRELVDRWDRRVRAGDTDVDLLEESSGLALDILGRTIFGADTRADAAEIGRAFLEILDYLKRHLYGLIPSLGWVPTPDNRRLHRNIRHLHALLDRMILMRRTHPDTYAFDADLLSLMLRAQDEWGEGMLERHLHDEVMTLYLAGHQTTSELVCWVFYVLAKDSSVEQTLHAELASVLEERWPTVGDLERLPYLRMVIDETLRLYPPAPLITKNARKADVVDGYRVPPDALVVLSPYLTHRHPDVWPDPERFDPLRHQPSLTAQRHRFAFFPFSAGYHSCIGASFALQETRLVIAALARRYRLRRLPGPPVEPSVTSTLTPHGLRMRLEPW
jgi:cytochrome P450